MMTGRAWSLGNDPAGLSNRHDQLSGHARATRSSPAHRQSHVTLQDFADPLGRFPFGRPPSADEVAAVAVFLASDGAAQVTGQTISVNGGLSFGGW
jgi:NAD(P)-dependent dehydrogenase (short-subunit alcohol dehydrogenase family)